MSSDLYVQSLSRGKMRIRRRKNVSGEVLVSFASLDIPPIHIINSDVVDVMAHSAFVTRMAIERSNIRSLLAKLYIEVLPVDA